MKTLQVPTLVLVFTLTGCTVDTTDRDASVGRCDTPNAQTCSGGVATLCGLDGVLQIAECDAMQGNTCDPDGCHGACAPFGAQPSYQGCDYYPTVTLNPVWSEFHFAVAVANTSSDPTEVLVTRGVDEVERVMLAPGGLEVITLPWVPELKGPDFVGATTSTADPGDSRLVSDGAYRLRTTRPVTVYQLSPLEYTLGPASPTCPNGSLGTCDSYSNDASVLLPVRALGTDYTFASWPSGGAGPSFVAVTATEDGTTVTLTGAASVRAGGGVDATGSGEITMNRGDVLQVVATPGIEPTGFAMPWRFGGDLSGGSLHASAPVQVLGGNGCAQAPDPDTGYCDHIEESLLPTPTLGTDYVVGAPEPPAGSTSRAYVLRVIATVPNTTVHFDPPIAPDTVLTSAAPVLEIAVLDADVHVTADQRVIVSQIMQGSSSLSTVGNPRAPGDPSLSLAVPVRQYRADYLFFSSSTYDDNWVMITAPVGAVVLVDGAPVPASAMRPAGAGHSVGSVPLTGEVHTATSDTPFGVIVYGYGAATSYMYPGGMDLIEDLM